MDEQSKRNLQDKVIIAPYQPTADLLRSFASAQRSLAATNKKHKHQLYSAPTSTSAPALLGTNINISSSSTQHQHQHQLQLSASTSVPALRHQHQLQLFVISISKLKTPASSNGSNDGQNPSELRLGWPEKSKLSQLLNHGTCWPKPGFIQQMETTTGTIDPSCVLVARVVGTEFGYMACGA